MIQVRILHPDGQPTTRSLEGLLTWPWASCDDFQLFFVRFVFDFLPSFVPLINRAHHGRIPLQDRPRFAAVSSTIMQPQATETASSLSLAKIPATWIGWTMRALPTDEFARYDIPPHKSTFWAKATSLQLNIFVRATTWFPVKFSSFGMHSLRFLAYYFNIFKSIWKPRGLE